jgi:putative hydrolase of the HAD superfamily
VKLANYLTPEIKVVMFDLGGVLVDLNQDACVREFEKLGVENILDYISKYVQNGLFLELERGTVSPSDFFERVRTEFGILSASDEAIRFAWNAFLVSISKEKLSLIKELKRQYRVILLSNTNFIHWEDWVMKEFSRLGFSVEDCFDELYLSYKMHLAKPEKEIFQKVLDLEGVEASSILFLDDGEKNIQMATQLGFCTYHVKEHEMFER